MMEKIMSFLNLKSSNKVDELELDLSPDANFCRTIFTICYDIRYRTF